jgi:hypothetical protein
MTNSENNGSDFSGFAMQPGEKWTYDEVADRVRESMEILRGLGIKAHRDSVLNLVFRAAEKFADDWRADRKSVNLVGLINAGNANRLADAIIAMKADPAAMGLLKKLSGSDVNFSSRALSQGKDAFWELELATLLRRRGLDVALIDPPDLVVNFGFGEYAIACKKVYSENNVEKQVSKGASQVVKAGIRGLVALNIDDLFPEQSIIKGETGRHALELMAAFNRAFLERHRMHLQRFVQDGRLDAILVSASCPLDVVNSSPRFNNGMQVSVWTLDELNPGGRFRLEFVKDHFTDMMQ